MAKLLCTECGYEFDAQLTACPECGNPASECKRIENGSSQQPNQQLPKTTAAKNSSPQMHRLTSCPECGNHISKGAKRCPHCGAKGPCAHLDFGDSIYDCFCRKYALFSGRSRRSEVFPFFISVLAIALSLSFEYPKVAGIALLITLIPWFAAIARRLHDIGRNGWWAICPIIPWIFICKDSDKETNEYGRSPKYDPNYVAEELPDKGTQIAMWCLIAVVIAFILLFFVFAGAIGGAIALSNGY